MDRYVRFLSCNAINSRSVLLLDGGLTPPHYYITKEEMDYALKYYTGLTVHLNHTTAGNNPPAEASAHNRHAGDAPVTRLSEQPPIPLCATPAEAIELNG